MPVRSLCIAFLASLVLAAMAPAQSLTTSSGPSLSMKLRALQTMNSTVGGNLSKSNQRIDQMTEYIKSKGLEDQWKAYTAAPEHMPQAMSFSDALRVAVEHEPAMGPADGANTAELGREVQAYSHMVESVWGQYQTSMTTVARMSDFLNAQEGSVDGYQAWAGEQQEQKAAAMKTAAEERTKANLAENEKRRAETRESEQNRQQQLQEHHQQMLNTAWQHHKFTSNQNLKYDEYAMKYQHGYFNNYGDNYGDLNN